MSANNAPLKKKKTQIQEISNAGLKATPLDRSLLVNGVIVDAFFDKDERKYELNAYKNVSDCRPRFCGSVPIAKLKTQTLESWCVAWVEENRALLSKKRPRVCAVAAHTCGAVV